jgi:nicotinate-nucleotide--dimethylbenzimidazole phosphoribosyltransferase
MKELQQIIESICPVSHELKPNVQAHLNNLTKPRGSLGRLEEIAMQYCLITGTTTPAIMV